ncbi:uncharacterized protein LOC143748644 [Siphateles boraxobius]|uniref:uncharacterized protein LOC143748644 n=1 Tax=Siphateles boraxobius TaxID=180520 RepID=UPI00406312E3
MNEWNKTAEERTGCRDYMNGYMNEVFREYLQRFVIVYIDDILIYSWNLAEHRHHVTHVIKKLREHHLYLMLGSTHHLSSSSGTSSTNKVSRWTRGRWTHSTTGPNQSPSRNRPKSLSWNPLATTAFQPLKDAY